MAAVSAFISRRFPLLLALAVCGVLQFVSKRALRFVPVHHGVAVAASGSFTPGGWYPGEPLINATGVRAWGSWSGSDENRGTIAIGPLPAPRVLRFGASGYPDYTGNALHVELVGTMERIAVTHAPIGERWTIIEVALPSAWIGRPIRIVGVDDAVGLGGWFGLSEPLHGGRDDGNNALLETLAAWSVNGLLLGVIFFAAAQALRARGALPEPWVPLGAGAIVAACGYAAFWLYFAQPLLGVVFSWLAIGTALIFGEWKRAAPTPAAPELGRVVALLIAVGAFELGALHLFPTTHDFYTLAANRYRESLPSDNKLPHELGERLFAHQPVRNLGHEWLSSDRPPLETGWELLTWPAGKLLGLDRPSASGTAAVWFQLLWVAAAYGLMRTLALPPARAAGWVAVFAVCGFFAQNTVFTWPKLSAGAFALGTFVFFVFPPPGSSERRNAAWAAFFAGLAWLSHGGVAFAFLALLPWVAARALRGERRGWGRAAIVLAVLVLPWLAYQKFYEPPANRLFKWHLAGQEKIDPRGTWETLRASYASAGWATVVKNKVANLHGQVHGQWRTLIDPSFAQATERKTQEFFQTGRAFTWWPLLALVALVLARRWPFAGSPELRALGAWLLLTIVVWCLLMFGPYTASIHQGSYTTMIGGFVLFSVLLDRAGRGWVAIVALLQAFTFATTWAVANGAIGGRPEGLPFVVVTAAALGWFVLQGVAQPAAEPVRDETTRNQPHALTAALARWWEQPRLNAWVLAALALALFLRKPHALITPQLWAEDGSIFLTDNEVSGVGALALPYMGYLHTLPRIIAWLAAHLCDPAWWPAFYNGTAFAIWVAVIARLFTRRFDLPGKPWLALAFVLLPHSGEVFFNVTNLQWLTAFVLIQQVVIAAPRTPGERIGDLAILALVSLTGPFAIAFVPLFVWRAWRERSRDAFTALAVVGACVGVQAWFVAHTGPKFGFQADPLQLWPNIVVLVRRLIAWPLLGYETALGLSPKIVGIGGGLLGAALVLWALRPDPRRELRATILAALALVTAAGIYRARPDTWAADTLDSADRYFYIPRVLLAWLVIWEFDAKPRWIAHLARLAGVAVLVTQIWSYTLPAPPDYHWAEHVEPIRRGVPAQIPTLPENWTLHYPGRPKK